MSAKSVFCCEKITKNNPVFSRFRTTIETAFYRNNVVKVKSRREAYKLALSCPGTIVTDLEVYQPEKIGLDPNSKVLLFNDGEVVGRYAPARRIVGEPGVNLDEYAGKLREAVYNTRFRTMYHAEAIIGLDEDFCIKAHLLVPEGFENTLYNWLLNFQPLDSCFEELYKSSRVFENEGDIFVFSDPYWEHADHPYGLTFLQEWVCLVPRRSKTLQSASKQKFCCWCVRFIRFWKIHSHSREARWEVRRDCSTR